MSTNSNDDHLLKEEDGDRYPGFIYDDLFDGNGDLVEPKDIDDLLGETLHSPRSS